MRATAPTWFEVRDASGRVLFARELAAGEAYRAQEDGLTVSASNAGCDPVLLLAMWFCSSSNRSISFIA